MGRPISFQNACNFYVNRYTAEHVPAHVATACDNGLYYAPQYASDQEWYDKTIFPGDDGFDHTEKHCMSLNQSWPYGKWLAKPGQTGRFVEATPNHVASVAASKIAAVRALLAQFGMGLDSTITHGI